MSCQVRTNRRGYLVYRIRNWKVNGQRRDTVAGTKLKDSKANRALVQRRAAVITAEMAAGTFDYLRWFPNGNLAAEFAPRSTQPADALTLAEWRALWIIDQAPPLVRRSRKRDYDGHWTRYLAPALGAYPLTEITVAALTVFRRELLKKLSLKTARNVIGGTLQAMLRDAVRAGKLTSMPAKLTWPRKVKQKPDPFTVEERDAILAWFCRPERDKRDQHRRYYPLFVVLFWMGLRPGEAVGLRWSDVDLKRRKLVVRQSRTLREDNAPKTEGSERTLDMPGIVAGALQALRPLRHTDEFVFRTRSGREVSQEVGGFRELWATALRATAMRYRKPYCTRHTFISIALSTSGANVKEIAEYCGTSVAMIEKHYGTYLRPTGAASLVELLDRSPSNKGTLKGTPPKNGS